MLVEEVSKTLLTIGCKHEKELFSLWWELDFTIRIALTPQYPFKIYKSYCRARISYGLEVIKLTSTERTEQEIVAVKILKNIQGLPDQCAHIAAYILLGPMSITSHIERQTLTVFLNIASCLIEHKLFVFRQLSMKDENNYGWFTFIRLSLQKYSLPTAYEIRKDPHMKSV